MNHNQNDGLLKMIKRTDPMITCEVPKHKHLPKPSEMQRMAVNSFTRPVKKWSEINAPVVGSRFVAYKKLAEEAERMLLSGEGLD